MPKKVFFWIVVGLLVAAPFHLLAQDEGDGGGELIAFHSDMDGDSDIYILNVLDGTLVKITDNDWFDHSPVWSHDGRIAFVSSPPDGLEMSPCTWDTGNIQCLPYSFADGLTWSADGRLAFRVTADVLVWDSSEVINLTDDTSASARTIAWSPDGILMYTLSERIEDVIYFWDGTSITRLEDNGDNSGMAWSADGRLVYRSSMNVPQGYVGGDFFIWDGESSLNITNTADIRDKDQPLYNRAVWSADGRLAFDVSNEVNTADVLVWDAGALSNITNDPAQNYRAENWSVDGRLAVISYPRDEPDALYIWDGNELTAIYSTQGEIGWPQWNPSGNRLIFTELLNGSRNLLMWDSGEVINLTDNSFVNYGAVWKP